MEDEENYINEYEAVVLKYNKIAMNYLRLNNLKESLILLRKAEEILNSSESLVIPNRLKLMSITLNNLGCYYKKRKQPKVALNYLEKALELESDIENDNANIASSHLNICAVYSSLNNHKKALVHAKKAIEMLEEAFTSESSNYDKMLTLSTSMVISYYNAAVEHEYLYNYSEALKNYNKALDLSREQLGYDHPMTGNIEGTLRKFESKNRTRQSRSNFRSVKATINDVENRLRLPSVAPRTRSLFTVTKTPAYNATFYNS
ncbi:hypothetical protein SteCoe_12916 [Stentor coeruleus]|uniref:Uncharacterized protein n=1 Tax=Stentor coeruleus TaxID=5963 RepID=A0A1R2C9S2_9CILI|nr:hypothetical protein SteCoe_12916 [Stentor coeruleus]